MVLVRRAVVVMLVVLAFVMKAPIFYLPYKISGIVGGGGYHRAVLMEKAWDHLGQWWFGGMAIKATADWFPYIEEMLGGADVTNQYLAFGLRAGLPAMLLLFVLLATAFRQIGLACGGMRKADVKQPPELILWGLGVALFSHAVSWCGVAYFDQSSLVWLMHLAAAAALVGASIPVTAMEATGSPPRLATSHWPRGATPVLGRQWKNRSVIPKHGNVSLQRRPVRRFRST